MNYSWKKYELNNVLRLNTIKYIVQVIKILVILR